LLPMTAPSLSSRQSGNLSFMMPEKGTNFLQQALCRQQSLPGVFRPSCQLVRDSMDCHSPELRSLYNPGFPVHDAKVNRLL
jgi:hypothetical protein